MDDKLALGATLVKKTGEGYTFGTWTDAYAYYLGASYMMNDQHKFQFYALGAPSTTWAKPVQGQYCCLR